MILGACHSCKTPQCEWTSVRCSKGMNCKELFCFTCLSKTYPALYGDIFRRICWACPACSDACKCDTCSDPVKKHELQVQACEQYKQQKAIIQAVQQTAPKAVAVHDNDYGWSCPRCSVVNLLDDIECSACYYHKRRTTRKRTSYSEPTSYEEKHSDKKEPIKRARETPPPPAYDDKSPPQKGRVSALRQLVKNPWTDGWELARKLALDLVEEAKQQAIRQGMPVLQVRQLPTKYQLANSRGTHVRKWFDREPTLAKKFLRAAGLICSKSNGTFINQDIASLDDLPPLILKADLSRYDEGSSFSGDEGDDIGTGRSIRVSGSSTASSPSLSPNHSPSGEYQPKLKVYYHRSDQNQPFVFKVPIADLRSIEEVKERLGVLLHDMGQTEDGIKSSMVLTGDSGDSASSVTQTFHPCTTMDELTRCSLLHVNAP